MNIQPTLLYVHGWAFDGSVWDALREALREALPDLPHAVVQAGYFEGQSRRLPTGFDPRQPFIVIGHSYGVMYAVGRYLALPGCLGLVSINGFTRFSAADDFPGGVATRVLDRMLTRLATRTVDVVDDFRQRCGAAASTGVPRVAALSDDLRAMRDEDLRARLDARSSAHAFPVLALASDDDAIVSADVTRACFPQPVCLPQGGHLLPLTAPAWCATHIQRFIDTILAANANANDADQGAVFGTRRNRAVGARFARAVDTYDAHAHVQRQVAIRLAESIAALPLPSHPRILEIGCGTGLLTRELAARIGAADWTITDIAAPMLDVARTVPLPGTARFFVVDGEHPDRSDLPAHEQYDLICSSLAVQWFGKLNEGLDRLARRLAPGGYLAVATLADGTFIEWQQAHRVLGLRAATPSYPSIDTITAIGRALPALQGTVVSERHLQTHHDGLDFVRGLKRIGAESPAADHAPLDTAALKRVLKQFTTEGARVTYHVAYGAWHKVKPEAPARTGVFVTGTDTGIGKTLTSAVLVRAWGAAYWKPLQSGLADESGDTDTVAGLARLPRERVHPPAYALQASLSPWDAARLENVTIDAGQLRLPASGDLPLVVEGAGGLYVPADDHTMMIDVIEAFGLPVVLVARSGLGTINHTLLSLHALRQRGIPVLGVIMSGPLSPGNRHAIERFGDVTVLAEIPSLPCVDADAVDEIARRIPSLESCLQHAANAAGNNSSKVSERNS